MREQQLRLSMAASELAPSALRMMEEAALILYFHGSPGVKNR
jgi:hypothetical protein